MSFIRIFTGTCIVAGVVTAIYHQPEHALADDHMTHMAAADLVSPAAATSGWQGSPGLPPSNNAAPARLKATNRHAEWVKVAWEPGSKDSLMAWVVYPMTSNAKTPFVIVVHEVFGLSSWVRGVADQVAAEGFIAVAPDLNSRVRGGPSTEELPGDSARKIISGVNVAEKNRGITAVARYAMTIPSAAPRFAVIGYCWGGTAVWGYSINGGITGFAGGVAYYGAPPVVADSLAKIKTPVLFLSGTGDARITVQMPAIDSLMKAHGKAYEYKNYQGAIHGFLRAQDDPQAAPGNRTPEQLAAERTANLDATKDAWPKTVAFLKQHLGTK